MKGCDRCGHLKRLHCVQGNQVKTICAICGCPKYLKPGTMR